LSGPWSHVRGRMQPPMAPWHTPTSELYHIPFVFVNSFLKSFSLSFCRFQLKGRPPGRMQAPESFVSGACASVPEKLCFADLFRQIRSEWFRAGAKTPRPRGKAARYEFPLEGGGPPNLPGATSSAIWRKPRNALFPRLAHRRRLFIWFRFSAFWKGSAHTPRRTGTAPPAPSTAGAAADRRFGAEPCRPPGTIRSA
jgi:hypothetical protein